MRHKRASEENEDAWVGGCKSERVAEEWFPLQSMGKFSETNTVTEYSLSLYLYIVRACSCRGVLFGPPSWACQGNQSSHSSYMPFFKINIYKGDSGTNRGIPFFGTFLPFITLHRIDKQWRYFQMQAYSHGNPANMLANKKSRNSSPPAATSNCGQEGPVLDCETSETGLLESVWDYV